MTDLRNIEMVRRAPMTSHPRVKLRSYGRVNEPNARFKVQFCRLVDKGVEVECHRSFALMLHTAQPLIVNVHRDRPKRCP